MFASITELLATGEELSIAGFGSFNVKARAARNGINPQTKAPIKIPARKSPHFKAGKGLKDAVNK
jgi:DNA-binding protein HU-beta